MTEAALGWALGGQLLVAPTASPTVDEDLGLATAEVAKLSGATYRSMQAIERARNNGSVQTMNRIFGMLGLKPGLARME